MDRMHQNLGNRFHGIAQAAHKIKTIQDGHIIIDQEQVVRIFVGLLMSLDQLQSLVNGAGFFDHTLQARQVMTQYRSQVCTVVNQQDILVAQAIFILPLRLARLRCDRQRNRKEELGAFTRNTRHLQLATHQFHQGLRNHKSKSRAAILTRRRTIRLRKGVEQARKLLGSHADTRILDTEIQFDRIVHLLQELDTQGNVALFGKLGRIVNQVRENLRKTERVTHQDFRDIRIHIHNQLDRTPCNTDFRKRRHFTDDILQNELRNFKILLFSLNLREVKNIIDDAKQGLCRMTNTIHKSALVVI